MKQVMIGRDGVSVQEVPAPQVQPGTVLVRVEHSCISTGTELSGVQASDKPLFRRVLERPEQLRAALNMAAAQGVGPTWQAIQNRLDARHPLGYSASGTVVAVGAGIDDIAIGERVACGGAQCAFHAEIIGVPRNLVVRIPENVSGDQASMVTIGAIALQGVRRAEPTLGETFVVIGLGLIGQLTVQLLKANGVRVIGADLDKARLEFALAHGLDAAIGPDESAPEDQVARLTDCAGADGVIITAASTSDEIVSTAFRMCRRKARVVLVGDVGLDIKRADIYEKELDFRVSTSYGPGRYDRRYEEEGIDYPIGYVRWTENRNMAAFLRLAGEGRLDVAALISARFPVGSAAEAYRALQAGSPRPLAVLLDYPPRPEAAITRVDTPIRRRDRDGALRLAVIGPGGFVSGTLLPLITAAPEQFSVQAVAARHGHTASEAARQWGARFATTDVDAILGDPQIEAVLIGTRHDTHGDLVLRALKTGKHVLVEKPLCLERTELAAIEKFFADAGGPTPLLLTGFNRRFSVHAEAVAAVTRGRAGPLTMTYRVNAGALAPDHWANGPEGGGRNRGEACHFYDFFTFLAAARVRSVSAVGAGGKILHPSENFTASIGFDDGSIASLTYTAAGTSEVPKERVEIFVDGKILEIDDFRSIRAAGVKLAAAKSGADKGHRAELLAFARAARQGGEWPIPLWQQIQATEIALRVEEQLSPR